MIRRDDDDDDDRGRKEGRERYAHAAAAEVGQRKTDWMREEEDVTQSANMWEF